MSESSSRVVSVEIYGLRYQVRSGLDPAYVTELASYVDAKMRAAATESPTGDSVRIAVVAAINIADEYFRSRESLGADQQALLDRTLAIERLVDHALEAGHHRPLGIHLQDE